MHRRASAAVRSGLVIALFTGVAIAAPKGDAPSPAPLPGVKPNLDAVVAPVRITGFRLASVAPYVKGPIELIVEVAHAGPKPLPGKVRVMFSYAKADLSGTAMLDTWIEVAPNSRAEARFVDPDGVAAGCWARSYNVSLMGSPDVETKNHVGWLKPDCTFKTKLVDSFNLMTPDRVEDATAGRAFLSSANLGGPYACGKTLPIGVKVHNASPKAGQSLEVRLTEVDGSQVGKGLANVGPKSVVNALVQGSPKGFQGKMKLTLADPTNSLGGKIASQAVDVVVERSCTLSTKLDGPNPFL